MATTERSYPGKLTIGQLEVALEAHETLFGELTKLEALAGSTVATYNDDNYPPYASLALVPKGFKAGGKFILTGQAVITGTEIDLDAYRTA